MADDGRYSQKSQKSSNEGVSYYGNTETMSDTRQGNCGSSSSSRPKRKQPGSNEFVGSVDKNGKEIFTRANTRIPIIQKSLAVVLASLLGVQVVIELKNDTEVTGTIDEADSNMNLTLHDVRQVCLSPFLSLFVLEYSILLILV